VSPAPDMPAWPRFLQSHGNTKAWPAACSDSSAARSSASLCSSFTVHSLSQSVLECASPTASVVHCTSLSKSVVPPGVRALGRPCREWRLL